MIARVHTDTSKRTGNTLTQYAIFIIYIHTYMVATFAYTYTHKCMVTHILTHRERG